MRVLGKNIVKRDYAEYHGKPSRKPCDYYWGKLKLPRKIGKFLWER